MIKGRRDRKVCSGWRLFLDLQTLDIEDEVAVGGNSRDAFAAVCEVGRNVESAFAADLNANKTNIPAFDDLANTEFDGERLALLVRCDLVSIEKNHVEQAQLTIKDLAVGELSNITHADFVALLSSWTRTELLVVNLNTVDNFHT